MKELFDACKSKKSEQFQKTCTKNRTMLSSEILTELLYKIQNKYFPARPSMHSPELPDSLPIQNEGIPPVLVDTPANIPVEPSGIPDLR